MSDLISSIGDEMARQDNRATQYPMFAIQEDVSVYVNEHADWEFKERNEHYDGPWCFDCSTAIDKGQDLPEDCDSCPDESFWYFNVEQVLRVEMAGIFFTAKACQEHIDENHYHYRNPKVYGIGSWRNPEMQAVQKHILKAANQQIPIQYQ